MSITVRFFASLRERLGRDRDIIDSGEGIRCAADVWSRVAQIPLPENTLVAINMEYSRPDQPVRDGDEVAFFPPVTGGAE
jgi:sulfur-carrier protein